MSDELRKERIEAVVTMVGLIAGYFGSLNGYLYFTEKILSKEFLNVDGLNFITNRWLWLILCIIYAIPFVLVYIFVRRHSLIAFEESKFTKSEKEESSVELGVKIIKRQKLLKTIYTLGLSNVRDFVSDWLFSKFGIVYLDYFHKPCYWIDFPKEHDGNIIYRMRKKDGKSYEYRYLKGKPRIVIVRETTDKSSEYGEFKEDKLFNNFVLFLITPLYFIKKIFF